MPNNQPLLVNIGQGISLLAGLPTITSWKNTNRPKKPKRGTFGYNSETNYLEYFDGHIWYGAPMKPVL